MTKTNNKRLAGLTEISSAENAIQKVQTDMIIEMLARKALNPDAISKMYEIASNRNNIVPIEWSEI